MIKVGFIGFNKSAHRYHLPFISEVDGFNIIGYYSRSNKQFEMPYKGEYKYFNDPQKLMKEVDLIIVTTPPNYHFEYTKMALLNNCHVICEKPFVNTTTEAKELFELSKSVGKKLFVYQNRRFDSDFVSVMKNINLVGDVYEIISSHSYNRMDNLVNSDSKYDGFVYGHAVHFLDQIISAFGKPNDLNYVTKNIRKSSVIEDYYDINLIYPNFTVRVYFNPLSFVEEPRFIIKGDKGTIIKNKIDVQEDYLKKGLYPFDENFGFDNDNLELHTNKGIEIIKPENTSYITYYEQVYNCITNDLEEFIKHEEVIEVLEIMQCIVNKENYGNNN